MDRSVCSAHSPTPRLPPRSNLVRYFVAPLTEAHDHVIESASAVHDTDGAAGIVVHVAESELDQPEAFPACTNRTSVVPADRSSNVFDRPVSSDHSAKGRAVRYFVAPVTAGHVKVTESTSAIHETDGAAGIVVHVAESELDQPEAFPACAYSVALTPADKLVVDFDRPVCSDHVESSELVRYFVAPVTAGHVKVTESASAVHETDGAGGMGVVVVQVCESVLDQPAVLPACTSSFSETPPDRLSLIFDRPVCSDHCPTPSWPPRSNLVWYFVAPVTAGHDQVIESASAVHDTDGSAGIVVHVAESEPDQPAAFPACTYSVSEAPADRLSLAFDRPVCSDQVESSELVWYFVAPLTAGHDQVIESPSAVHDTDGVAGIVVQVAVSDEDQPAALPARTSSVSEMPADRLSLAFDRPVCSDHWP